MTYQNEHESQYGADRSARTRSSGCTWTSGANGADYATQGRVDPEPDAVLAKVARTEETAPLSPGWSLPDLALAMRRLGVPFEDRSGAGWAGVRAAHAAGLGIVLQGDSDRFPDGTCSGAFDGDHAVFVPGAELDRADGAWRYDDPICPSARYAPEATLRAYAEKLAPAVRFGVFVSEVEVLTVTRYGPWTVDIAKGTQIYDLAGRPDIRAGGPRNDTPAPSETTIDGVTYLVVVVNRSDVLQYELVRPGDPGVSDRRLVGGPKAYSVTVGGKVAGTVTLP